MKIFTLRNKFFSETIKFLKVHNGFAKFLVPSLFFKSMNGEMIKQKTKTKNAA